MFYTVYRTTNKVNNKTYIGVHQTKDLNDGYLGSGTHLRNAVAKYGRDSFVKEILFIFDTEAEMDSKERELVTEEFCSRDDTYNICEGGFGGGYRYINRNGLNVTIDEQITRNPSLQDKINKHSKEKLQWLRENDPDWSKKYSQRLSDSLKGHKRWVGKSHKLDTRQRMSLSHIGKHIGEKNSQYGTCWITDGTSSLKIPLVELDNYLTKGYHRGRKFETKETRL